MSEIGGVWRTIGGRRIFIKDKESLSSAMKRSGKFEKEDDGIKILTREQYNEYRQKQLEKNLKEEEEEKQRLEEIKNSNLSPEEKWNKQVEIENEYMYKNNMKRTKANAYDPKTDSYIMSDTLNVFEDDNKKYNPNTNHEKRDIEKLSEEERHALTNYTSEYGYGNYKDINSLLYDPNKLFYDNEKTQTMTKEAIKNIDSAMSKCTLGQNCLVYRGVEPDKVAGPEVARAIKRLNNAMEKGYITSGDKIVKQINELKGQTIENKGYMSTSTTVDPNWEKRGVVLVIEARAKDKAIHMQGLSKYGEQQDTFMAMFNHSVIQKEDEILFDRNTNLKIKKVALTKRRCSLVVRNNKIT